jgi:hypothetical protein
MLSKLFLGKLFLNFSMGDTTGVAFLANAQIGNRNRTHKRVAVNFFTARLLFKRWRSINLIYIHVKFGRASIFTLTQKHFRLITPEC